MAGEGSFRDRLIGALPHALRAGVQQRVAGEANPPKIRKFHLKRKVDESGVSGTGIVAVGVVLPSKRCVIEWTSKRTQANSLGIYDNMEDVEAVHGHEGATEIVYDEE
jgi:hypothetical protein